MAYFCCQLIPPRATFPFDMTEVEREQMMAHAAYIRDLIARGTVKAAGPVFDPKGAWGVVLAEADSPEAMRSTINADPVIMAGLGFRYTVHPMPSMLLPAQDTSAGEAATRDHQEPPARGEMRA